MIALDAAALVSFLTGDDPGRMEAVREHVEAAHDSDTPIYLPLMVIDEAVTTLTEGLRVPRLDVRRVLLALVDSKQFQVERAGDVRAALQAWTTRTNRFRDLLLLACARGQGATLYTADTKLAKRAGAALIG